MSNYELREHKRSDKIKWIITGVAFVLAFVMIIGICLQIFGQGKVKPSEWFTKDTEQTTPDNSEAAGGVVITENASKDMRIMSAMIAAEDYDEYGIDGQSVENVYNLSVTYTPADTTYQETTYSIAFKNSNSTWATGKTVTDYATVTQSAVGSKDATLTVLQPFSEQIIVTATCNRNTAIKATTTVDYVGVYDYDISNYFVNWIDASGSAEIYVPSNGTAFINGTFAPQLDNSLTVIFDTTWLQTGMTAAGYDWADSVTYNITTELRDGDSWACDIDRILLDAGNRTGNWTSAENADFRQTVSRVALDGATPEYLNGDSSTIFDNVKIIAHRTYNGVTYDDVVLYDNECILRDWGFFEISATGMTSNTSSIVAG